MSSIRDYMLTRLSLDARTLACFRILLALLVLVEWCSHDMLNMAAATQNLELWSIPGVRLVGTVVTLVSILTFGFGYRTRWSALVLWLAYSLFHVSVTITDSHFIICVLLLFSVFLPLGRCVAFDDAMDRGSAENGKQQVDTISVVSIATAGLLVFALLTVFLLALVDYRELGGVFTATLVVAPVLTLAALLPTSLAKLRFWIVASLVMSLLLVALYQAINSGDPVHVLLLVLLASLFLTGAGWSSISERPTFQSRHDLRIYYDEPCGFCRKICFIFASFMLLGRCSIATAQSDQQAHTLLRENDSWVVFDSDGKYALCWAAVLLLMRASPLWRPLGYALTAIGMGTWGKPIYRLIGNARSILSYITARVLPYRRYRLDMTGFEKGLVAIWLLMLLLYYFGVFNIFGVVLPDSAAALGFDRSLSWL